VVCRSSGVCSSLGTRACGTAAARSQKPYEGRRNIQMPSRSVRLYTAAQFEEIRRLVDLVAERSDLPPAERGRLTAFQADLKQTLREDRRRAAGTARLPRPRADVG
jgi:hypothetical protein